MFVKILAIPGCAILVLLGIWSIIWPPSDPILDFKKAEVELLVYQGGTPVEDVQLPPGSLVMVAVEATLKAKKGKWKWSLVSWAPNIYLIGEKFSINIGQAQIVINYQVHPGKSWMQVKTALTREEKAKLEKAVSDFLRKRREDKEK